MYEYLRGQLIAINPLQVVIEINGIGYKLSIPVNHLNKLPSIGETLFLYTAWIVRETSQTLYGFLTRKERDLFEMLLTFSGIGPKTALAIMGHLEWADFEQAVLASDGRAFARVPGIGKKTAERLMVDLRGRLSELERDCSTQPSNKLQDVLNALIHLGYTQAAAEKAVKKVAEKFPHDSDLSTLITAALQ